jgi:hypothetical protein
MVGLTIVAATLLSYAAGWAIGVPALLPILNTVASFPFMVLALKRAGTVEGTGSPRGPHDTGGNLRLAVARMLLWALTMGITATLLSYARPAQTGTLFVRGEAYQKEMFAWVLTGEGAESTPSQFIPQQAGHALLFSAIALATGGAAAMPMGAVLMNDMGHYVGVLAATSRRPALTMILGWHPWAVIRVVSFVVIGVVLSTPLLSRLARFRVDRTAARTLLLCAGAGLIADVVLKTLLAPVWRGLLVRIVGW